MKNRSIILTSLLLLASFTHAVEYGTFPEEELLVSKLSKRSYELRDNDHLKAIALMGKISRQFKSFVDATRHDFSKNLSKNRMTVVPIESLNANDVTTDTGHNYILFALPRDVFEANRLFEAALQKNCTVFVSLLESHEAKDKFNNFWQAEKLSQIKTNDNWIFVKKESAVIGKAQKELEGSREPQLIETKIEAINTATNERRILTHLHYESWKDRQATPSEPLLQQLMNRIEELQLDSKAPVAIHCHGGVGRTGVVVLSHYLRQVIKQHIAHGKKANEVTINIPQALFGLRMQRDGLLESATQIASIYSILGAYVAEKMQPQGSYPIVPKPTAIPPMDDPYYELKQHAFRLGDIHQTIKALKKHDSEGFDLLTAKIHIAFSKFGKCKRMDDGADAHHITADRMKPRPIHPTLNCYDINVANTTNYMLLACPHNGEEVANFYDALFEKEGSLVVSLLKTEDGQDRCNNFWKKEVIGSLKTYDGWTVTPLRDTVLAASSRAKVIETILEARHENGMLRTVTHLHYDGWLQDGRMPDRALFSILFDRIEEVHSKDESPIAFHSKWGVGRSGVALIYHHLRKEIDEKLSAGQPLDDIRLNIAKSLFEFRRQRSGLVTHSPLVEELYDLVADYYEQIKQ